MPRRRRQWMNGACYHVTHRCHERQFLFRYAKYRDMYRKYLFHATQRFNVSVLAYVVTSNHVHLLLGTGTRGRPQVSEALQYVHGEMGQHYNLARSREGSFWSNRFHATRVESGIHLERCLFYIDMNMVRAGVVNHPAKWEHGSAYELASPRQRYRVVDRWRLAECLRLPSWDAYAEWYGAGMREITARQLFQERQPLWSEALAVGSADWGKCVAAECGSRRYLASQSVLDWPPGVKTVFISGKTRANAT